MKQNTTDTARKKNQQIFKMCTGQAIDGLANAGDLSVPNELYEAKSQHCSHHANGCADSKEEEDCVVDGDVHLHAEVICWGLDHILEHHLGNTVGKGIKGGLVQRQA